MKYYVMKMIKLENVAGSKVAETIVVLLVGVSLIGCENNNATENEQNPGVMIDSYILKQVDMRPGSTVNDLCVDSEGGVWISGYFGEKQGRGDYCSSLRYINDSCYYVDIEEQRPSGGSTWTTGISVGYSMKSSQVYLMLMNTNIYMLPSKEKVNVGATRISGRSKIVCLNDYLVLIGDVSRVIVRGTTTKEIGMNYEEDMFISEVSESADSQCATFIIRDAPGHCIVCCYDSNTDNIVELCDTRKNAPFKSCENNVIITASYMLNRDTVLVAASKSYSDHRLYRLTHGANGSTNIAEMYRAPHSIRCINVDDIGQILFAGDRGMIGVYRGGHAEIDANITEQRYKAIYELVSKDGRLYAAGETADGAFIIVGDK